MKLRLFSMARQGTTAAQEITARLVQPPSVLMRIVTLLFALWIGWHAWNYLRPPKPALSPALQDVASRVVPRIVQDLRAMPNKPAAAAMLHLTGDSTDFLTSQIRLAIQTHNIFDLSDPSLAERFCDTLRMRQTGYGDLDLALKEGKSLGEPAVLFGAVHTLDSDDTGQARVDMEILMADVASKAVLFNQRYTEQIGGGALPSVSMAGSTARVGFVNRILAWAVMVLLLPVFTITFIRSMVRRGSNSANAFTLAIYTAVGSLLAHLMLGMNLSSALGLLVFLILVGAVLLYNVSLMTFALRLET